MASKLKKTTAPEIFATIAESLDDAIIATNLDGIIFAWNRAAAGLFGYSAHEMIGQTLSLIFPPERMAEEDTVLDRIGRGERIAHNFSERRHTDGHVVQLAMTTSPIRDAKGLIVGASRIIRDVTEQEVREQRNRELQAQLVHAQHLSEIGQLISAMVHEVNQPLTAIANYISASRRLAASGDHASVTEVLRRIECQTWRTRDIGQRIRSFVSKRQPEFQPENLSQVVHETIALARTTTGDGALKLTATIDPATSVCIDRIQVQQVLLNLLRNGIEAMQGQPRREMLISAKPRADAMVEIRVEDCGPGLAPEVRDKLFQPLVTTKSDGMGVGLSVCRSIIEAHSGQLWADTAKCCEGTAFHFTLPDARRPPIQPRTV